MDISNGIPYWRRNYQNSYEENKSKRVQGRKVIQKKGKNLYLQWKDYDNSFNNWIDKKIQLYKMSHFSESLTYKNKIEVGFYLSNYATKSDSKNKIGVDNYIFAKEDDFKKKMLQA